MMSSQHSVVMDDMPAYREREPHLRPRLLIVEDALCMQKILRGILRKMDVEVDFAENGEVACKKAEMSREVGRPYELILMDMHMPHVSGYEATRRLREKRWQIPIIAVTAYDTPEDRDKCIQAGCTDYISKPITEKVLRATLAQYLQHQTTQQNSTTDS